MAKNDLEFKDVIFTDECSVQLESHRKINFQERPPSSAQRKSEAPSKDPHMGWYVKKRSNISGFIFRNSDSH